MVRQPQLVRGERAVRTQSFRVSGGRFLKIVVGARAEVRQPERQQQIVEPLAERRHAPTPPCASGSPTHAARLPARISLTSGKNEQKRYSAGSGRLERGAACRVGPQLSGPGVITTVQEPAAVRPSTSTFTLSPGTVKLSPRETGASASGG